MARSDVIKSEIHFNLVPVRAGERLWGTWDLLAIQICFGIAAWFFLVGSLTGLTVPAGEAVPIILVGNVLPLFLIAPLAALFARYGVEHWTGSSAVLGHVFKDLWLIVYITSSFGWIAFASFLFGEAAIKFVAFFDGPDMLTSEVPGAIIFAFAATAIGAYIAFAGPNVLKWFTRVAAVFLLAVLAWLTFAVFAEFGASGIYDAEPAEPFPTAGWSRASALEFNVGLGFSWAFWYGQWTRLAKSESAAFHGCLWGWGLLACTAGVFSAFTALAIGTFDPSAWIVALGGTTIAILGLTLFAVANVSSVAMLVYPMSITLRSRFPKLPWVATVLICSVPALPLENPTVFEGYGVYLAYIALLTGTYGGIMVADYHFVSRRGAWAWSMRDVYDRTATYRYYGGFNPAAVLATLAGAAFYLWTLNPWTWTSANGLFPYITAGIPSFVVAFVVYAVLMRLWIMRVLEPPSRATERPGRSVAHT